MNVTRPGIAATAVPRLNDDKEMLTRMELDLVELSKAAMTKYGIASNIHGVFSLDDLERKTENQLCEAGGISVGIGYQGARNSMLNEQGGGADHAGRTAMVEFRFMVILGVPTGDDCAERYNAGELLSVLRLGIQGHGVASSNASRSWAFVSEGPEIGQSNSTVLYYVQLWQTKLSFSQSTRS